MCVFVCSNGCVFFVCGSTVGVCETVCTCVTESRCMSRCMYRCVCACVCVGVGLGLCLGVGVCFGVWVGEVIDFRVISGWYLGDRRRGNALPPEGGGGLHSVCVVSNSTPSSVHACCVCTVCVCPLYLCVLVHVFVCAYWLCLEAP